jgi:hypothetical protein
MPVNLSERYTLAIARFDALNARDPYREELAYAEHMTRWLDRMYPDASEPLRLAARCQHIRRWEVLRNTYPMDRPGYLAWRKHMYDFHADVAAEVLVDVGYDGQTIARVRSLLRKERLKLDPDAQALEDVACLVFLENYSLEFVRQHAGEEEKVVNILRRTWAKMSDKGRQASLALAMPPELRRLVEKALAS